MGRKRNREDRLVTEGPSYIFHYEDREFWKSVKKKALDMRVSVKDLIVLALKHEIEA